MRDRIRFWLKISAGLTIGLIVFSAANPAKIRDLIFDYKSLLICEFGTPEQIDRLSDEAGRRAAAEGGDLEWYETRLAFRDAVEAQKRLADLDEGLADCAVRIATAERDGRRGELAQNYP